MKTFLKYALLTLMWAGVAAYVVYAAMQSQRVRKMRKVARVEIDVVDSTSHGQLVSSAMVREWIARSGLRTRGTAVDAVDLTGIEQLIARNGFVERACAWVSYSGTMHISISQREPLLRLLVDGMNSYVTEQGTVFVAPRASSLYVPVVTGSYRPPFPAEYSGNARAYIDAEREKVERRIAEMEREKYPIYKRELENDRNISALRRMRVKRQWWRLESSREFEARVDALRERKAKLRRDYRYRAQVIQGEIEAVTLRQQQERLKQKKLEKSYEDFMKLLTFVKLLEEDGFWRSEVVQIAAYTAPGGALEVELIPRSGRHTILFGRVEQVEQKFDKLLRFYRNGLQKIGWEEYRSIDVRYKDQVICKK